MVFHHPRWLRGTQTPQTPMCLPDLAAYGCRVVSPCWSLQVHVSGSRQEFTGPLCGSLKLFLCTASSSLELCNSNSSHQHSPRHPFLPCQVSKTPDSTLRTAPTNGVLKDIKQKRSDGRTHLIGLPFPRVKYFSFFGAICEKVVSYIFSIFLIIYDSSDTSDSVITYPNLRTVQSLCHIQLFVTP